MGLSGGRGSPHVPLQPEGLGGGAPLPPSMGLTPGGDESLDTSMDHLTEAQEEEAIPEEVR